MFKFRRTKKKSGHESDSDDEPMTGKGHSSSRSVASDRSSDGLREPKVVKSRGGLFRSRSAPRTTTREDHDSLTDGCTASDDQEGQHDRGASRHGRSDAAARESPVKNCDDDSQASYPSVGMNVVSSNGVGGSGQVRGNTLQGMNNGLSRKGSRGNNLAWKNNEPIKGEEMRRREVERAMGDLNSSISSIKRQNQREQPQQQQNGPQHQQHQQLRQGQQRQQQGQPRPRARSSPHDSPQTTKNVRPNPRNNPHNDPQNNNSSTSNVTAQPPPTTAPPNNKHRRTLSSGATIATHITSATVKTTSSDKTGRAAAPSSSNATEHAAMQHLAMLVVSLRSELEDLTKEKNEMEQKYKNAMKKKQHPPAPPPPPHATPQDNPLIEELKRENIELRADIDAFLTESDILSKEIAELKVERETSNDLIERLKKEAHNASFSGSRSASATGSKGSHASEAARQELDAVVAKNRELSVKVGELTDENHKLEGELRLLVDEKQDLMRKHSVAAGENSSRMKEVEELKSALKESREKYSKFQSAKEEEDGLINRLKENIADLTIVKEELKRELKDSNEYVAELEKELEEKNQGNMHDMQQFATEVGNFEKRKAEFESQLRAVEEEKSGLQKELECIRRQLRDAEEKKGEFQKMTNQLDVENVELTRKVNDLVIHRSRVQSELEKVKHDRVKLEKELEDKKMKVAEVQANAAIASAANDCSADTVLALQKMISSLEDSKEHLEADLAKRDAQIKLDAERISELEQIFRVQDQMKSMSDEEESELKIRITSLLSQNEQMKPKLARLERTNLDHEQEIEMLKRELTERDENMENLATATELLQSKHAEQSQQMSELQETVSSLQQTKDRLEADLQEASEAITLLEDELEQKDSTVNGAMVQMTILRQHVSQLEKQKVEEAKCKQELVEKVEDLENQIKVMELEKNVASEELESLKNEKQQVDTNLLELAESASIEKENLTAEIAKLQEELEESSDAIALLKDELGIVEQHLSDSDANVAKLEKELAQKTASLKTIEAAKTQIQTEHKVNIETISHLQKMIHGYEKSKLEIERELKESLHKAAELDKELKNSAPTAKVQELEQKLSEADSKHEVLMERVMELTTANDEMRLQVKELLNEVRPTTTALVPRSESLGSGYVRRRSQSSERAVTCNHLLEDLKEQIQELLSERDSALEEVRSLKRDATAICHRPDDDVLTIAPEDDIDDDMTHHTSAVETKPCEEDDDSIPKTIMSSVKSKPTNFTSTGSSHTSRGSSLLEQAKKICHEIDEKRSKTPDQRRADEGRSKTPDQNQRRGADAEEEISNSSNAPSRKQSKDHSLSQSIKTVHPPADEKAVETFDVSDAKTNPPSRTNSNDSGKKFDIDQLTAIYFEKCGMSASKLSDVSLSSEASSSVRRRAQQEKNSGSITKKVKICRNGVFMGTYEGDLNPEGQRHGFGVLICDNGNSYEGDWKKDKRDGLGIARYSSGDVYDGEWQRGKRQGHGVMYIEAGDTYIGSWNNGLKHGAGTYHWADGEVDVSWYEDDRRVGQGVRWNSTRNKAYRLIRGTRQEEITLDEAYKTAEKLGLNLAKVDS